VALNTKSKSKSTLEYRINIEGGRRRMGISGGCDQKRTNFSLILSSVVLEEFEDTKGVIRIRKSKKDRQHNGQK
jgi:hypothetical protein